MTINETVREYYKENKVLDIQIRYAESNGAPVHRWTEQEYNDNFGSFFDGTETILTVSFQSYYITYNMTNCSYRKKEIPFLYILFV